MNKNSYGISGDSPMVSSSSLLSVDLDSVTDRLPKASVTAPPSPRLVAMFDESSVGAEKFRVLAARLQYLQQQQPLKKLVVTSTIKGEGKSVVSANLAVTIARRHKTLLIDGDLRQSGLADMFGSGRLPGLTDWWQESTGITRFLRRVETLKLWHLPAGQAAAQPLEILQSQRTSEMLNQISGLFDWVIIDAPPLIPVADPNLWATQSDGTLLVVKQGKTPKRLLQKSLDGIENLKLIGIVVNASREADSQYYRQYYKGHPGSVVISSARER